MAVTKTGGLRRRACEARERGEAITVRHVAPSTRSLLLESAMAGPRAGLGPVRAGQSMHRAAAGVYLVIMLRSSGDSLGT